jgi:hypothetical protein
MPFEAWQEWLLMAGALVCAFIAYKRCGWMAVVVWLQIFLYYVLVSMQVLTAETRHIYGRINILAIMSTEVIPYVMARLSFWLEFRRRNDNR